MLPGSSKAKTNEMLEFEYARSALINGLMLEAKLGTNPYKFGMIGSTDMHTGLAATEEENFFGKTTPQEPSPERMTAVFMDNPENGIKRMDWEVASAGYAAVWAADNTRTAIWDAMYRKETYATTGTRMIVRLFGGWDFNTADTNTRNPAVAGYAKGVPMGGDLSNAPAGKAPSFLVAALKDPIGASQRALYYARVIEIPTPRRTAYDAKRFGVKPQPGTRMTITERAYTSPIWYTP